MWKWGISPAILVLFLQIRQNFCGKVSVLKFVNCKKNLISQFKKMFTNYKIPIWSMNDIVRKLKHNCMKLKTIILYLVVTAWDGYNDIECKKH